MSDATRFDHETQRWQAMTDKARIWCLMKEVLGWEIFEGWDGYRRKYGKQEYEIGAGNWFTTPTPVAYYDVEGWRVWSCDHEDLDTFDPLHNMKDAWLVAEQFEEIELSRHLPEKYLCEIWHTIKVYNINVIKRYQATATTAQEAICMAALKIHGVEIE